MTYREAIKKMAELAAGRDWSLAHITTSWPGPSISAYIADVGVGESSKTYKGAIKNIERLLKIGVISDAPPVQNNHPGRLGHFPEIIKRIRIKKEIL